MKTTQCFLLFVIFGHFIFAQEHGAYQPSLFNSGRWMLGGVASASFSSTEMPTPSTRVGAVFRIVGGLFVKERWMVGGSIHSYHQLQVGTIGNQVDFYQPGPLGLLAFSRYFFGYEDESRPFISAGGGILGTPRSFVLAGGPSLEDAWYGYLELGFHRQLGKGWIMALSTTLSYFRSMDAPLNSSQSGLLVVHPLNVEISRVFPARIYPPPRPYSP